MDDIKLEKPLIAKKQKLGDYLVEQNIVTDLVIVTALTIQERLKKEGELFLLGEILLEYEMVDEDVLHRAIKGLPPQLEAGREFGYLMMVIRASIGADDSRNISTVQENNRTLHILDIINKSIDSLPYKTQKRLIVNLFRPYIQKLTIGVPEKVTAVKGNEEKVVFKYDGKIVHLDFCPRLNVSIPQVIVSKYEYDLILKLYDENGEGHHESKGTFGGEMPYSVHDLVSHACDLGASDIHIVPKQTAYHVYFRVEGSLINQKKYMLDITRGRNLVYAFKNIAASYTFGGFLADDKREIKDGRIEMLETGGGIDLRIVALPTGGMLDEEIVARIIKKTTLEKKPLTEMGYFPEDALIIEKAFQRHGGLFLTSGKTSSGKTTFSAQLLLRDTERKWETIEDPIEYFIPNPNICQHQTYIPKEGPTVGFGDLVKGFKRGDPDGIFVGEIRQDPILVKSVFEAAHAGQLVMSTVHISSCFEIYRAMEEVFGVDFYTSASKILYSHNQTLVKCLCKCKIVDSEKSNHRYLKEIRNDMPFIVKKDLDDFLEDPSETYVHNPKGCAECGGTGYKDRTPVYEYIYPNVAFTKWLLEVENPDRYKIEEKACASDENIGVNKLSIFIKKLKAGIVDASHQTIKGIM